VSSTHACLLTLSKSGKNKLNRGYFGSPHYFLRNPKAIIPAFPYSSSGMQDNHRCPRYPRIRLVIRLLRRCYSCGMFQGYAVVEGGRAILIHCGAGSRVNEKAEQK
jgi:hypothetical protein